jgi:hypothetical protein
MSRSLPRVFATLLALGLAPGVSSAQTGGSTAALSGVVVDQNDGVVPGVTVVVRNNATGVSLAPVVTNRAGLFLVAALDSGSYTVTFALQGFKTAVVSDVRIVTATPADLRVTLEAGPVTERVTVHARSPVIQTQSTTVSATLYSDQIRNLPLNTRDALNFVTLLTGVDTGLNHVQRTATSIVGLPMSAIMISIDGIQTQNPLGKSGDGFWSHISPNIDAMEEVTVTTGTPAADASGQGAIQIKFTTKSGTNKYAGSLFETWRHPFMYANTFFNKASGLPVNQSRLNDFGGNVGGPLVLPGFDGRGKVFFFTNYDELRQASEISRRRTMLSPSARTGRFSYASGGVTREVNVLTLAADNRQLAVPDPTIARLLGELDAATTTTGSTTLNVDGNTKLYTWNSPDELLRRHWTSRLDVGSGARHRLSAIYNFNKYAREPDTLTGRDPRFPGLPAWGSNTSYRNSATGTLRSTLSANVVNEATIGSFWQTNDSGPEVVPEKFANQGGYSLTLLGGSGVFTTLAPATAGMMNDANGNGNRSASNPMRLWSFADKLSWQRGRHGLQFGAELTLIKAQRRDQQVVPAVSFGVAANVDPADNLFTTANFPGASTTNLADARFLYALLTGRVTSLTAEFALDPGTGQYVSNSRTDRRTHMYESGFFVQDAFRVRPNLTLNLGLRYELQLPLRTDNSVYSSNTVIDACGVSGSGQGPGGRPCNFFMPGTLIGDTPAYEQYAAGTTRYQTDLNNLAPSVGISWLPGVQRGPWRTVLGDPDQATLRAGYARAFNREGLGRFAIPYEANPGASFDDVRSVTNGNLVPPGETWPLLFRDTSRLAAAVPPPPSYPLSIDRTAGVNLFDPAWEVGLVDSFSVGFQRSISRDMAVEIRYLGTRGRNLIEIEDWNELNIVENGFLEEFKLAQANLLANVAAGRGATIAHTGAGTSPLPTYLAYFTGSHRATDPAAYTGTPWTNGTIVGRFAPLNPNPSASAVDLHNDARQRANALTAGLPANFFVLNPDVTPVNVHVSKGTTRYDALQLELRRRLSQGLAMTASYSFAKASTSRLDSLRVERVLVPSINAVPHSWKFTATYDLPFGRGRRFGGDVNPWIDGFVGGWALNVTGKVTSGRILNFGNVRLSGMTADELQRSIEYRIVPATATTPLRVYNLPQDIIDNTIRAFSVNVSGYTAGAPTGRYFAPANGPDCIQVMRGDCAPADVQAVAPPYSRVDFGARKQIGLGRTMRLVLQVDVLNLFNAINFNPVALPANPTSRAGYEVTESYQDINNLADPGSRIGQLVVRFTW